MQPTSDGQKKRKNVGKSTSKAQLTGTHGLANQVVCNRCRSRLRLTAAGVMPIHLHWLNDCWSSLTRDFTFLPNSAAEERHKQNAVVPKQRKRGRQSGE